MINKKQVVDEVVLPDLCDVCGAQMGGVEYDGMSKFHYDGISEWACPQGHVRIGRWCQKELHGDELEPVDCKGVGHPREIIL